MCILMLPVKSKEHLIWLDLEMSGLDPDRHVILEIGSVITDNQLNLIAEGPSLIIHQSEAALSSIDPWCVKQHGDSGLLDRVRHSNVSLEQAGARTLDFLRNYCFENTSPLCGNSIGQDRRFLRKYMPALEAFFHYRNIDVSSIKELVQRWYPKEFQAPEKSETHHVMDDIRESLAELQHYRQTVFK